MLLTALNKSSRLSPPYSNGLLLLCLNLALMFIVYQIPGKF